MVALMKVYEGEFTMAGNSDYYMNGLLPPEGRIQKLYIDFELKWNVYSRLLCIRYNLVIKRDWRFPGSS